MLRLSRRALLAPLAAGLLAACASMRPAGDTPLLRLAPAALGRTLALQQRLSVSVADAPARQVDAMLEADAQSVRLALLHLGRTAARLEWDGQRLAEERAPWWPEAVRGERILSDLQLALWPAEAVRAALPAGWTLDEDADARTLRQHGEPVATVSHPAPMRLRLVQHRQRYSLDIESRPLELAP